MSELLGIDLSEHRANISEADFDKLHEGGCRFLGVRVSVGDRLDETAERFAMMAQERGWVTIGYHYLTAEQNVGEAGFQQGALFAAQAADLDLDGYVLDVEATGLKWSAVIHAVAAMRQYGLGSVGLYSRRSYYQPNFGKYPDPFDWEWWADYRGGSRWLGNWQTQPEDEQYRPGPLWQFSDKFHWSDPDGEKRAESVDGDVFQGTQLDLLRYMGR